MSSVVKGVLKVCVAVLQINASTDLDERSALRSLVGVIDAVKKAVEKRLVSSARP